MIPASMGFSARTLTLLLLLTATLLTGCSAKDERDERSGADVLYERAHKSMDSGNYANAVRYFEGLEARFPFSNQTKQAQLDLIYCYYRDGQTEAVIDAASQFERENPTHPRVDYALYMRGLANFSGQHSWYHRLFRIDLTRRPPKDAQEAFSVFAQLVQRFPDSAYAADARQRMVFLRNRLAAYENHVAGYYLKRGAWMAALNRARFVLEEYEGAPVVPESLRIMVEAYDQLGMRDLADDTRRVLADNYPAEARTVASAGKPWYRFW